MYIEVKSYINSYLKKMCILLMYLEYNLMGCWVFVCIFWKVRKLFGICGGFVILLVFCKFNISRFIISL